MNITAYGTFERMSRIFTRQKSREKHYSMRNSIYKGPEVGRLSIEFFSRLPHPRE